MKMTSIDKKIHSINENKSFSLIKSSKEFLYIKQNFKSCFDFIEGKNEVILKSKNTVGILDVGNSVYRIYPKVGNILGIFSIINRVNSSNYKNIDIKGYLYLDTNITVNVESNNNTLIETLILIFLNELCKVSKIGYTKNYIDKKENINFLKGKLNLDKQIRKNILGTKFYCSYNDITFCTAENIILYKCIDKILKRYKINKNIKYKLLYYKNQISELIEFYNIENIDLSRIIYYKNRTNLHYETVISIAEVILKDKFASTLKNGNGYFCNFMVRTDLLFQQYIYILLNEVIKYKYENYYIKYQHTIDSIKNVNSNLNIVNETNFLKMKADFLIIEKSTERVKLVIDTKYIDIYSKNKLTNASYYQMISYVIGLNTGINKNTDISAILLVHGDKANSYKIPNEECNIYIMTEGINILQDEEIIKNKLEIILNQFLVKNN